MRNRFTEIWVPPITSFDDLSVIVRERFAPPLVTLTRPLIEFVQWFRTNLLTGQKRVISLRWDNQHICHHFPEVSPSWGVQGHPVLGHLHEHSM